MSNFKPAAGNAPIIQMAFVVPDIRAAIDGWVNDMGAGPWFLVENLVGDDPVYRGEPAKAAYDLASTFVGDMQIELIEMKDEHPSPFREWVEVRGFGFHHVAVGTDDAEAEIRKLEKKGYENVFSCESPLGGRIAFMSAGFDKPGMIEVTPMSEGSREMRKMSQELSAGWDGKDPVRIMS